ncbi:MAG: HDOD domain-containing protein, partial [Candidatus Coatesbacteria bacterium]|nr:HDOD domain-containing protein [Candidatus Coatesbacteria bacterium]
VAGLLHDIGQLAILDAVPGYISQFMDWGEPLKLDINEVEMEVIGIDHGEISGRIFKHWNFPETLTDAVRHHHNPELAEKSNLLAHILYSADRFFPLACAWGAPMSANELAEMPFLKERNIAEDDIAAIKAETEEHYGEIAEVLGV